MVGFAPTINLIFLLALVIGNFGAPQPQGLEEFKPAVVDPVTVEPQLNDVSTCLNRVNIPTNQLHWTYIPTEASELETSVSYAFLAGQLIQSGAVDASYCPTGGVGYGGYANACGQAAARPALLVQNSYDESIMEAWRSVGIPPVLLKQLIRYESQFWPGRYGASHYGLGHLTYLGAWTALQWNIALFHEVCNAVYGGTCTTSLINDTMVYTLLNLMNAECADCPNKIDLPKAKRSIRLLAEVLLAYCNQTSHIVYNVTNKHSSETVDYVTIWKLTLMNYNAGPVCVYNAINSAYPGQGRLEWYRIASRATGAQCKRGVDYANKITE
jgi:hypothetical protein